MADVLVSTLLEKLASTTYQYVADEVKLVLNAKKEVEEFISNLEAIESVLEDAEQRQVKDANVQRLVGQSQGNILRHGGCAG